MKIFLICLLILFVVKELSTIYVFISSLFSFNNNNNNIKVTSRYLLNTKNLILFSTPYILCLLLSMALSIPLAIPLLKVVNEFLHRNIYLFSINLLGILIFVVTNSLLLFANLILFKNRKVNKQTEV